MTYVWLLAALLYTMYAASTYTGLYQLLADFQSNHLGYNAGFTCFLVLVCVSLPTYFISPQMWKRPGNAQRGSAKASADPLATHRATSRVMFAVGAACLVIGVGAGLLATWQSRRTPVVAHLDLAQQPSRTPDLPQADQLVLSGVSHPELTETVTERNGGTDTSNAYTPITAPDWHPGQAITYVMRETVEAGNDPGPRRPTPIRFGPAAILHHQLPGLVRSAWDQHGVTGSSAAIVLDTNLSSSLVPLWIVCAFGCIFGVAASLVAWLVGRQLRSNQGNRAGAAR